MKTSACHALKATRPKTQHVSARIRTRARRESYLSTQAASGRRTAISNAHEIPARYSVPIVSGFLPVSRRALPSATGLFLVPYSSGFSGLEEEASDWTRLCRWRRRAARFAPKCGYTRVWRNYLRARVLPDGETDHRHGNDRGHALNSETERDHAGKREPRAKAIMCLGSFWR